MKISHDGTTVSFKTEPEELFEAEKSGAKSNTVRILDAAEADRIKRDPPKKIIIQHDQEIFLRTLTNIREVGDMLREVIVIFSWTHKNHHHAIHDEKGLDPKAHTMSLDEGEPPIDLDQTHILIPRSLLSDLNWHRGDDTLPEFISKLLKDRTGGQ